MNYVLDKGEHDSTLCFDWLHVRKVNQSEDSVQLWERQSFNLIGFSGIFSSTLAEQAPFLGGGGQENPNFFRTSYIREQPVHRG